MKILILSKSPRLFSTRRLLKAARNLGHSAVAVNPNPVKFELASSGDRQVQTLCLNSTKGDTEITELRVVGTGLRLINARDLYGLTVSMAPPLRADAIDTVDVEYVSDGTEMDGMLVLSFINEHGKEMTLGVPIYTCG